MLTIPEAKQLCLREFAKLVGQKHAKNRITELVLGAIADGGFMAPLLVIAPPGLGKSRILKTATALIRACLNRRPLFFEHGEALGSRLGFVEDVLVPQFQDKEVVLVVDEIHEAKKPVLTLLRSMLDVTVERKPRTIPAIRDYEVTFDPCKQSMMFATNKVDQLDPAFLSRPERLDLSLYTDEEMEEILQRAMNDSEIRFNDNTLRAIAECNRGTARDIVHWSNAVRRYVTIKGKRAGVFTVSREDVKTIIKSRETYPLGITNMELQTLLHLESKGELQLKELSALNIISTQEQNANERYLLQRHLIGIESKRRLLPEGRDYLKNLRKHRFIPAS